MKFFKFLTLSLFVFSFLSCDGGDDDQENPPEAEIAGKWTLVSGDFDGTLYFEDENVPVTAYLKDIELNWVDFKSDETYDSFGGDFTMVINYEYMGEPVSDEIQSTLWFGEGTWTKSDTILITHNTEFDDIVTYQIDKLTETELKLTTKFLGIAGSEGGDIQSHYKLERL